MVARPFASFEVVVPEGGADLVDAPFQVGVDVAEDGRFLQLVCGGAESGDEEEKEEAEPEQETEPDGRAEHEPGYSMQ